MAKISILIPVYNAHDYLHDSIPCLLNQTFEDIELICVNDGSKDDSLEILNEFAAKDSRIKVIDKENGGCGSARNRALDEAGGEYIYFFDPDDRVLPVMYREMLKLAVRYAFDFLGAEKITIGVFENNPQAYRCYRAVGFRDVTDGPSEVYHVLDEDWKCLELEMLR